MIEIRKRKVGGEQPLGEMLKIVREGKQISLDELSRQLKIKEDYLSHLEKGEYLKLPGEVFVKNFLKAYAVYFQLSSKTILSRYESEKQSFNKAEKKRVIEKSFVEVAHRKKSFTVSKVFRYALLGLIILAVLSYLGWEINNITAPPSLEITFPAIDMIVEERLITVMGITTLEAQVTINDQTVAVDELGNFEQELSLQPVLNNIEVRAQKKHSRTILISREILFNN